MKLTLYYLEVKQVGGVPYAPDIVAPVYKLLIIILNFMSNNCLPIVPNYLLSLCNGDGNGTV